MTSSAQNRIHLHGLAVIAVLGTSAAANAQETGAQPSAPEEAAPSNAEAPAPAEGAASAAAAEPVASSEAQTSAPIPLSLSATTPAPQAAPAETPAVSDANEHEKKEKSWTDYVKLNGDFRYRFEILKPEEVDLRYRHRIRARLGVVGTVTDGLDVGIQVATGSNDPVSTNQTLGDAFSKKPVNLDLAYLQWRPTFAPGLALTAGKMHNPFYTVGKSELLWDPDLTPEGIALGYQNAFGIAEPFIQTAGFYVEERKEERDSWILAAQVGMKLSFLDGKLYVLGGVEYVDYTNIRGNTVYADPEDAFGNSSELVVPETDPAYDPDAEQTRYYLHDYNTLDGFLELGGKIGPLPWMVFGDIAGNLAVDDDDLGWLVGAQLGKCKNPLDFDIRYIYREVQNDAVVGAFTDSDFIDGGTGGRGHEWNLGFQIAKGVKLAATYFYNFLGTEEEAPYFHRVQIDFKLKF